MTWLLCDYGEVLCLPQPDTEVEEMASLCELARPDFEARYWQHRSGYDRGDLDGPAYWSATLGRDLPPHRLAAVMATDTAGWLHPNPASLEAVARAGLRGLRLAVLSNAPEPIARAIDGLPWLNSFSPRLFSCDLGVVKPEAAIYQAALRALEADAGDVVFLDDRADNVEGARAAGIRAEVFADPSQIDAIV